MQPYTITSLDSPKYFSLTEKSRLFVEHLRTLSTELPIQLLEAVVCKESPDITLEDHFSLERMKVKNLRVNGLSLPEYTGSEVIFLASPTVSFAYCPATRKELGNNMADYGLTDRVEILPQWISLLADAKDRPLRKKLKMK